jgi:hypothetical protein
MMKTIGLEKVGDRELREIMGNGDWIRYFRAKIDTTSLTLEIKKEVHSRNW